MTLFQKTGVYVAFIGAALLAYVCAKAMAGNPVGELESVTYTGIAFLVSSLILFFGFPPDSRSHPTPPTKKVVPIRRDNLSFLNGLIYARPRIY